MAIKNKDGTVYRLREPNPLVKDQQNWSEKIVLHNFGWHSTTVEDQCISENQNFIAPPEIQKQEIQNTPKPAVVEKQEIAPETSTGSKLKNIVIVHCQPAIMELKTDDLYGDKYSRQTYGEKMLFEGAVVDLNDLTLKMWTTYGVIKGSIIYPSKYKDGRPFGERRWWKIGQVSPYHDGFLLDCVPSDYQPDFS